ncbi:hypothetical protein FS782_13755 [Agrobacterium vitis]|uniref:hypothetical protein n=1 Tax=Agrobacterium vitis TaxID=373 RepID=UPI001F1829C7|nr:hypothetical protein [Agrobacterium vitis]MCF1478136.1 hypothetical protein [Agrobacterium vitis]
MPSIPDEFVPIRATSPQSAAAQDDPGFLDTLKAAGVEANWPYRAYRYLENRADVQAEPDYNPFPAIKGTKFESDPERFAFARNEAETRAIMSEWDEDENARAVLGKSGWSGTVAMFGMGLLDPTVMMPLTKVFSGVAEGANALRLGADAALTGAAGGVVGQSAMMATTPHYTIGDAALGVGTATVLSGLLGAGAGALLSRGERKVLEDSLHADREAWGEALSSPQSVGAAASDTRQLELDTPSFLKKLPDPTGKVSPPRRVLNSDFEAGRRAVVDLVETPYIFKENSEGIATTQGPALDRLVKLETGKTRVGVAQNFDQLYTKYRFGEEGAGRIDRALTGLRDLTGRSTDGKMTFPEWKSAVDDALRNGDEHAVPEVAEAAKFVRKTVLDPWRDRAIKAGLLPDDLDVKTADSYMMRMWNKEKLIAQRPKVVGVFTDWLEGQQVAKATARDKISGLVDLKENYAATIDDLEAKISARMDRIELDLARAGENTSVNKFAYQRAMQLREAIAELDGAAEKRLLERARGGAVFETRVRNRQNLLADRISGMDAEVDDLTRRVADLQARHDRVQADIEKEILGWEGKSSVEAKSALKARTKAEAEREALIAANTYNGRGGRMISADTAVNSAVRKILARGADRSRQELESLANEIVDRIVGGPDGRLSYDAPSGGPRGGVPSAAADARGPLAHRNFMIPDNLVRDYLETDVQHTVEAYLRTMVPDVLLTEKFGDTDMTEVFRRLNEEASAKEMAAKTEGERLKIRAQKNAVETDIAALRDRVRHIYGFSSDPRARMMGRIAATAARYDMITNLGGAALSSLSDLAGLQWRHGFATTFKDAWRPMLKSLVDPKLRSELGKYRDQMQALGVSAETYLSTRSNSMHDVLDVYKPTSRFERATSVMADKFGLASLLTPWTDFGKFAAGMVSGAELSKAADAVAAGKGTARQIRNLAEAGIDNVMADRIAKQLALDGGSDMVDNLRLPNTANWTDKGARDAFEGALARDVDLMILTPGAEKPLVMSNPVASLVLQYKTFVVAANERLLVRSLQARDHQVLQGAGSAIVLGMIAEYAYSIAANRDAPKNPSDWIKAGINRSGILGWYSEGNSILAKWTGGAADAYRLIGANMPDARYISRSPGGALLGPVFGKAEATVKSMSTLLNKALGGDAEWKASDTTNLRRLVAGQNLFLIRRLLVDNAEDEVDEWLGIEPPQRGTR